MRVCLGTGIPTGKSLAVGITGTGKLRPIVHHATAQRIVARRHRTPATPQSTKYIPQLGGMECPLHVAETILRRGHILTRQITTETIDISRPTTQPLLQQAPANGRLSHDFRSDVLRAVTYHVGDVQRSAPMRHVVERIGQQVAIDDGSPRQPYEGCFLFPVVSHQSLLKPFCRQGTHLLECGTSGLIHHALAHSLGIGQRLGGNDAAQASTTLDNGPMNQPFGQGRRDQRLYTACTGTLAEERDTTGITAKGFNVALHPFQGSQLVQQAEVAGALPTLFREQGVSQKTANAQTIVQCDQYHASAGIFRPVELHLVAISVLIGTAMNPHHDRQFVAHLCLSRLPHVQIETIFAHLRSPALVELPPVERALTGAALQRSRSPFVTFENTLPGLHRLGCFPSQLAYRRCRIGNTLVEHHPLGFCGNAFDTTSFNDENFFLSRGAREAQANQQAYGKHLVHTFIRLQVPFLISSPSDTQPQAPAAAWHCAPSACVPLSPSVPLCNAHRPKMRQPSTDIHPWPTPKSCFSH